MEKDEVLRYVEENKTLALKKASYILDKEINWESFNGIIGGKNDTYSVNIGDHETAESYVNAWFSSHQKIYKKEINASYRKSSHKIHDMLQDDFLKEYITRFLARSYFKNKK